MSIHPDIRRPERRPKGVALLLVLTTIAVLALVLVEFSSSAHTHLASGVNVRDDVRATQMADTALVMTRACLDDTAWGPMAGTPAHRKMDFKKLCDIMLGMFIRKRVDLPIGGLSLELNDIKGLGLEKGDVEEIELTTEDSYIGLGGLRCPTALRCQTRVAVALQLRTVLCDPAIAHVFEKEQEDGKRYTREEVVGNLVDWQDADDNRINIDPLNWGVWSQGAGEGEDAYLRDLKHPYLSKDEPLNSIEELRLIRGINDELYEFLKDKVSIYSTNGKVNPNGATSEVISALIQTYAPNLMTGAYEGCGEDQQEFSLSGGASSPRDAAEKYARIIEDAKNTRIQFKIINAFADANSFVNLAKDPLTLVYNTLLQMATVTNQQIPSKEQLLMVRYGLTLNDYSLIQRVFQNPAIKQALTFQSSVYRLRVRGTVGNMTKQVFAILRDEGQTVRTLYYREE